MPIVFAHFAGFEGEYFVYLTEKRVKWAERGGAKVVAGVVAVESELQILIDYRRDPVIVV